MLAKAARGCYAVADATPAFSVMNAARLAVGLAGFCAFLNLYSPQALLPQLAERIHVGAARSSALMTAGTLAVAFTAPFTGALAESSAASA